MFSTGRRERPSTKRCWCFCYGSGCGTREGEFGWLGEEVWLCGHPVVEESGWRPIIYLVS